MKDWTTLQPDVVRLMTTNFTKGRGGKKVRGVMRHHNAGVNNTTEDLHRLWTYSRAASCHYQIENTRRIGQLVWDDNTAHHAAHWGMNQETIGLEHANTTGPNDNPALAWNISEDVLDEGAHLAAAILRFYKLGPPEYGVNVFDHRDYTATSCPHHLARGGMYDSYWFERAMYWYIHMDNNNVIEDEPAMALTTSQQQQLNRIEDTLENVMYQLGQPGGHPQGGGRTLYDLTAAVAEIEGVPGTRDTLDGQHDKPEGLPCEDE